MNGIGSLGRLLLAMGVVLALVGLGLIVAERFPGLRIGRLPGDLRLERGHLRVYFPIATSIVVSVILTLVLWLLGRR